MARPFYAIDHKATEIVEVRKALEAGANAVECDIRYFDNRLWVEHDDTDSEVRLDHWLDGVRNLANAYGDQFALVIFDIKEEGMSAHRVWQLREQVRTRLTDSTGLNVIFSVAELGRGDMFDQIHDDLGAREALSIDEHDSALAVVEFFRQHGVNNNCFGNGTSAYGIEGSGIRDSLSDAIWYKRLYGFISLVYVWTIDAKSSMRRWIDAGVDGMLTNHPENLTEVLRMWPYRECIRLATREESPFPVPQIPPRRRSDNLLFLEGGAC